MSMLTDLIRKHEGKFPKDKPGHWPYTDTVGKLTVGYGRNLTDNGLSEDEAEYLLQNDVNAIVGELSRTFPWYRLQLAARQDAFADMAYNLGMPRFKGFQYMIAAMERADYVGASAAMLDSKWAEQVGERAKELAKMVQTGDYQ